MNKFKKIISLILISMFALSMLAGCAGQTAKSDSTTAPAKVETKAQATEQLTIGVSMDNVSDPFWQSCILGMEEKADELGIKLVLQSAEGDANKQNQQIENLLSQKVGAIICSSVDSKAILTAVKKAHELNTPFICLDRPVAPNNEGIQADFTVATDNFGLFKMGGEWLLDFAKKNSTKLKILQLQGSLTDQNVLDRDKGLRAVVDANKDNMEIIQSIPTEWNVDKALAGTVNAFQANPDINTIVIYSDFLLPSVFAALKQLNKYAKAGEPGHVIVASIAGDTFALDNVKDGYVEMDMGMQTLDTGRNCVSTALDLINGKKPAEPVQRLLGFLIDKNNFADTSKLAYGYYVKGKTIKLLQ